MSFAISVCCYVNIEGLLDILDIVIHQAFSPGAVFVKALLEVELSILLHVWPCRIVAASHADKTMMSVLY